MSKETREKIYRYTYQRLKSGHPPTLREVQRAVGVKAVETVRIHLEGLVEEGLLVKHDTHSRSYALPPEARSQETQAVPILGQVQAGALTLALQEPDGFLSVERRRYGEELFFLRVEGYSMQGAGILPGDLVLVRRQEVAQAGDIVVALLEEEATVKRLRFKDGGRRVVLQPENEEFLPLEVDPRELKLLGKVVEVRRFYEGAP